MFYFRIDNILIDLPRFMKSKFFVWKRWEKRSMVFIFEKIETTTQSQNQLFDSLDEKGQKQLSEVFYIKSVLKNFAKFTGIYLCRIFFKESCRPLATLIKKRLRRRGFLVSFAKLLKTPLLQNTSERLLLKELFTDGQRIGKSLPMNFV